MGQRPKQKTKLEIPAEATVEKRGAKKLEFKEWILKRYSAYIENRPTEIWRLKYELLAYGLVKRGPALDRYLNLIQANLKTEAAPGKTQKHHGIPISFFREIAEGDFFFIAHSTLFREFCDKLLLNNLTVNLLAVDHFKAHWYLYKAARTFKHKRLFKNTCKQIAGMSGMTSLKQFKNKPFRKMVNKEFFDLYQGTYEQAEIRKRQNRAEAFIERKRLSEAVEEFEED